MSDKNTLLNCRLQSGGIMSVLNKRTDKNGIATVTNIWLQSSIRRLAERQDCKGSGQCPICGHAPWPKSLAYRMTILAALQHLEQNKNSPTITTTLWSGLVPLKRSGHSLSNLSCIEALSQSLVKLVYNVKYFWRQSKKAEQIVVGQTLANCFRGCGSCVRTNIEHEEGAAAIIKFFKTILEELPELVGGECAVLLQEIVTAMKNLVDL